MQIFQEHQVRLPAAGAGTPSRASWIIIIAGIAVTVTKGIPRGVEFAGGTVVIEQFDQPVSVDQVRAALDRNYPGGGGNAVVQAYGDPAQRMVMIRVPRGRRRAGASLSTTAAAGRRCLEERQSRRRHAARARKSSAARSDGKSSPRVCSATVLSLVGILAYLAFRFQFSFGVGAVVATIHDLLITMAFLAFFRYDLSLNVIAAILTMTGYSTNDTIVIFDRVRENMRSMRRDSLHDIINVSVNQTLSRTIITAGTALLTALALFFFGGEVLHGFAFTMVVGHHHRHLLEHLHRGGDRQLLAGLGADPRRRARARRRDCRRAAAARAPVETAAEGPGFVKLEV